MLKLAKDRAVPTDRQNAAPRVQVDWRIGMKTFGTQEIFEVMTKDISLSGILVKAQDPKVVLPFQIKTLLEVIFYPDGELMKEEIRATAVVVRSVYNTVGNIIRREQFGVRIVDAPEEYERAVHLALSRQ